MTQATVTDLVSNEELLLDMGRNVFADMDAFGPLGSLNSLDHDLLRVGAYVYTTDLAIKRLPREKHIRSIRVRIPVANIQAFQRIRALIEQALTTVSADNWQLEFEAIPGASSAPGMNWPKREGSTLLFSGGLDSFAGALDALTRERAITLVSHITHNRPVENAQSRLASVVQSFTKRDVRHVQIRVHGRNHAGLSFPSDTDREDTQRTRSFLFLSLAAIAARLHGTRRILLMAENGQFAIHLPLTEARIASFSTHTAHPKFLAEMQEVFRQFLMCPDLEISNPFCYLTKAQVVGLIPVDLHPEIENSSSCWRVARVAGERTHCGECVPCLSRRIALETHGIKLREYQTDLFRKDIGSLPVGNIGKQNLVDMCQFIAFFDGPHRLQSELDFCLKFPDLFKPHVDRTKAIGLYRQFGAEARAIFSKHRKVRAILG
jgi:7-cyano-7-deazaguanine synthase in queuosine biosynthesis